MTKKQVIIDTDIGYDPDDLFALFLILNSPEVEISLIVTADEIGGRRAAFTKMILEMAGRDDIEVVRGAELGNRSNIVVEGLMEGKTYETGSDYISAIKRVADRNEKTIFLGIGGFTNIANFFKAHPDYWSKLDLFMMGGAINYSRKENWVEHNIKIDRESAEYIVRNVVGNLTLVMAQTTFQEEFEVNDQHPIFKKLKMSTHLPHTILARHSELFNERKPGKWSRMHDPLTFATAIGKDFVILHKSAISIDEKGTMRLDAKGKEMYWSDPVSKKKEFMDFLEERLFAD